MRAPAVTALVVAVALVTGCGAATSDPAKNFTGADAEVANVIDRLADSAVKRDTKTICKELLAPASVRAIQAKQGKECDQALRKLIGSTTTRKLQAEKVTVNGNKATVVVKVPRVDGTSTMTLRRTGSTWRIVLPVGS